MPIFISQPVFQQLRMWNFDTRTGSIAMQDGACLDAAGNGLSEGERVRILMHFESMGCLQVVLVTMAVVAKLVVHVIV